MKGMREIGKVLRMFTVTPRKATSDCSSDGKGTVETGCTEVRKEAGGIYTHTYTEYTEEAQET